MKQRKRTKQRLLTGMLCAALVVTNISLTGFQASATEAEIETGVGSEVELETEAIQEVFCEEFYEEEELTGVYQFGGAPSNEDDDELSPRPVNSSGVGDAAELEEYIYQQLLARNTSIDMIQYNIAWDDRNEAVSIVRAVLNEHPELYFVDGSLSCSGRSIGSDVVLNIISITYHDDMDDAAFEREAKRALAAVKSGMSDLEKAIVLHDYLAVNCEYDYENYNNSSIPEESYSAYGVLVNRTAVCQGYALAYKYLLNQVGIACYMVSSNAMNHAWNLVELNGNYYQVDVTWDDPTWDRIGRAGHSNMFRSDDAFVNECEHYSWSVTKGNDVVAYQAADTSYDSAFWVNCNSPLVLVGTDCYYVTYDAGKRSGVINKTTLSDITGAGETIYEIGSWTVWGGSGTWQNAFSGLFYVNDRLYYNDKSAIYSLAPDSTESNMDKHTEFTADITNGYIYGSAFCQGEVLYSLRQTPNIESKETVLTADISIEVEEPAEVPVESIALDKETLELTVGDTAALEAAVTPDNAADAVITWESSDISVAEVKDGAVTAIAAGRCTITATAGGKEAVCDVTVKEKVLASGSYQDITWAIDMAGKLTVTGTGDFSDASGFDRAPWYDHRESIISADINVTGMTDASAMLYDCRNLISADLSGLDTERMTDMQDMFSGCTSLTTIDTPCNLTISVELPISEGDIWRQPDGTEITKLPQNMSDSIRITKNGEPANPAKETYTVTFDLQGHGTALEEYAAYTKIGKGSLIQRPASPEAEGYEFTGWYKEADCRNLWDFEKDTVEGNTTLYAGWKNSKETEEKTEEKPQINSVLFPKQKSEYSAVYTGEQIRPVMVVACQYTDENDRTKTQKLKLNVDYTVRYSNNVNVGENTASVTVRGIGEYTGSITKTFTIAPKSISNVTLSSVGDIVFGEKPSVRVTDGTKELAEGRDYIVQLSTKGAADEDTKAELTVEGAGNYTGVSKKKVKFNILKTETDIRPITDKDIRIEFKKLPAKGYTYNGKAQKPGVVVTDMVTGKKVSSSMYKVIYSDNINAGEGTAKAWVVGVSKNGKGYYGISDPLYFDIRQKDFKKVSVSLSGTIPKAGDIQDIEKAVNEAILVKDGKHVLSESEYTIDYGAIETAASIEIGKKYPITLTPRTGGNYAANSQKTFNVKFGQLNLASKTAKVSVRITDAAQNEIEFYYNGILLEKEKDYTATVKKDKNKDTYTVKIKAAKKSGYKGSRTLKNMTLSTPGAG